MLTRRPENPLITPHNVPPSQPDFEVIGVFNAGVTTYNGETLLLLRVAERPRADDDRWLHCPHLNENGNLIVQKIARDDPAWDTSDPRKIFHRESGQLLLTSISHLRLARSQDGVSFTIEPSPWLQAQPPYENFGTEDARITRIDETYYVNYTAVSEQGIATGLASTTDFQNIKRHGILFPPASRDVTLFPEKISGLYACYHRPMPGMFGAMNMWVATSPDLIHWGQHRLLMASKMADWSSGRVGGGAPPVRTPQGWLSIYHAADREDRYCLGAFLTPLSDPGRIIAQSADPILTPDAPYEREGFFSNVVFACGATLEGDRLRIYYGAADERMALVEGNLDDLLVQLSPV
jgi:predicted GH43/DUF377 family glycosyl hydrolase